MENHFLKVIIFEKDGKFNFSRILTLKAFLIFLIFFPFNQIINFFNSFINSLLFLNEPDKKIKRFKGE